MPRQTRKEAVEVMVVPEEEEEITASAVRGKDGEPEVVFFSLRRFALPPLRIRRRLSAMERLLKREEADVVLVAGNVALVAFEIVEWPVAALTLAVHALARTRWKTLQALAEVAEEVE